MIDVNYDKLRKEKLEEISKTSARCIAKWEKKLAKEKKAQERWGEYIHHYPKTIALMEEALKDLKRLSV